MFQRGSSCTMSAAADAVSLGSETSRRARPSLATLEHRREGGGLAYAKSGGPRRQLRLLLEMASYPAREPAVVRRLDCIRRRNTGSAHEGGPGGWPYQRRLKRPPLISCGSHCRGGAGGGGSRRATRRAGLVAGGVLARQRGALWVVSVWSLQLVSWGSRRRGLGWIGPAPKIP